MGCVQIGPDATVPKDSTGKPKPTQHSWVSDSTAVKNDNQSDAIIDKLNSEMNNISLYKLTLTDLITFMNININDLSVIGMIDAHSSSHSILFNIIKELNPGLDSSN